MKKAKFIILFLMLFTLNGCTFGPRINAKNKQTLETSFKEFEKELDFVQFLNFQESMSIIFMDDIQDILKFKFDEKFYKNIQSKIDGKNYNQIVNSAVKVADGKIKELENYKNKDKENSQIIEQLKIKRFILNNNLLYPVLFIELENKSNLHFIGAKFEAEIYSPDDEEPIESTDFILNFNGVLYANYNSQFQYGMPPKFAEQPEKSELVLKITALYGENFKIESKFTREEQKLLDKLKKFVNKNK